jgi:dienelactone hydrolase
VIWKGASLALRAGAIVLLIASCASRNEQTPAHTQSLVFESESRIAEQAFASQPGSRVSVAGVLRVPYVKTYQRNRQVPAVVIIHGSSGIGPPVDRWVNEINRRGFATFVVDSFSSRGITSTISSQDRLPDVVMGIDALRALQALRLHPSIGKRPVAVLGFSKGASAALLTDSGQVRRLAAVDDEFDFHLTFHTPCYLQIESAQRGHGPIWMFHGAEDDISPIEQCSSFVSSLKTMGRDVRLFSYPEGGHGFDYGYARPVALTTAETARNCLIQVNADGALTVRGVAFDRHVHCTEKGGTIISSASASERARHDVGVALDEMLKLEGKKRSAP